MGALDMRTVFTSYLAVSALCAIVIASLWFDNRSRSSGIGYWFADYLLQSTGLLLITLRGVVPDFLSIVIANVMIFGGTLLLLVGLETYVGKPGRQWHNAAALVVFGITISYFAFVDPNLAARNISGALVLIFLTAQIAWLMIRRTDPEIRPAAWPVGLVMIGFIIAASARIAFDLNGPSATSLFDSPLPDSAVVLANQILFIALTLALVVMINRRLLLALGADLRRRMIVEKDLRKSEAKFSAAFHTIPEVVLLSVVETGELLEANESFYRITGYPRDEAIGNTTIELGLWAEPNDRQRVFEQLQQEGSVDRVDVLFRRANGEVFTAELSAKILSIDGTLCTLSVTRDVTAERLAQQQLRERTEELLRSNRDLEQFAYVASHDLQEPLRMVINYTQLLQRRYAGKLDSDAEDFMGFALEGAHRMHALITELLAYSRVQSTGRELARIELEDAFEGAARTLASALAESAASLTHDPLPAALGDHVQMEQVFLNLIGNALKFQKEGAPSVHVGAVRAGDTWTISVKDNGIGIESEYFDQVFQIYRRLQTRADYPGTGMGLAICKRLLERHGQRIWVESEPGQGSTFFFTVAAAE